eukprot:scaffold227592_cov36-Attheya_sp.AAC.2
MPCTRQIERAPIRLISSNVKRREGKKNPPDIIAATRCALGSYRRGGSKESHWKHFRQKCPGENGDEARKRARVKKEMSDWETKTRVGNPCTRRVEREQFGPFSSKFPERNGDEAARKRAERERQKRERTIPTIER